MCMCDNATTAVEALAYVEGEALGEMSHHASRVLRCAIPIPPLLWSPSL